MHGYPATQNGFSQRASCVSGDALGDSYYNCQSREDLELGLKLAGS